MKWVKRTTIRVLFALFAVLAISWGVFYFFSRKPIRKLMTVEYSVADPAFRTGMNGLIGRPFIEGNRVETFVNGTNIFPAMLEGIRSAKKSITFETYIWSRGKICDEFKKALAERAK